MPRKNNYPPTRKTRPIRDRFFEKVQKTSECWVWTGNRNPKGYGQFSRTRQQGRILAHRMAWEFEYGPIPEGLFVLHKCDNPPCVNPAHLWLGTKRDNNLDMRLKGRGNAARGAKSGRKLHPELWPVGENVPSAKLTTSQVIEIRTRYSLGGETYKGLAFEFGVKKTTVENIVKRRKWKHLKDE